MKTSVEYDIPILREIEKERRRQVSEEGFDKEHDGRYPLGTLAAAAACYAANARHEIYKRHPNPFSFWPFDMYWWKPKSRRRDLIRAAALIVAEIGLIDRRNAG